MSKLLFVSYSLASGGAERVFSLIANECAKQGEEVHFVIVANVDQEAYRLNENVHVYRLGLKRVLKSFTPIFQIISSLKPKAVYSTLSHLNCLLLFIKPWVLKQTKFIIREGSIVSLNIKHERHPRFMKWMIKRFYLRADHLVCQSKYMIEDLESNFSIPRARCTLIYNPIEKIESKEEVPGVDLWQEKKDGPHFIFIGRLNRVKRVPYIIEQFAKQMQDVDGATLWIIGDGEEHSYCEKLLEEKNLRGCVKLIGQQSDPYPYLHEADALVLASEYEGLPNVLIQAIACACPVLVEEHPGGSIDILEACDLKEAWQKSLNFRQVISRERMQSKRELCLQFFELENIAKQFLSLSEST